MKKLILTGLALGLVSMGVEAGSIGPKTWADNGHWYILVDVTPGSVTWDQAQADAVARGGTLATLTSAAENQWVYDNLVAPAYGVGNTGSTWTEVWLGGSQLPGSAEPGGGWQWVTGEAWSFTNWNTGEPNNSGTGGESKLTINRFGNWKWNDSGNPAWASSVRGYVVEGVPDGGSMLAMLGGVLSLVGLLPRKWRR